MHHSHEILRSWLGVFDQHSMVFNPDTLAELQKVIELFPEARAIGANHSYNRSALHPVAVRLGPSFDYVEQIDDLTYRVGGATSIEDVMLFLRDHGARLPNSGNHRQQTLVGACVGGTHGFGVDATMMDSVIDLKKIGPVIYEITIKALPLASFLVTHCVCPLSELGQQSGAARSYAVMPYSGDDPLAVVSEYEPINPRLQRLEPEGYRTGRAETGNYNHRTWWRIRVIQWAQKTFPWLHRLAQKSLNLAKMRKWHEVTAKYDIDALYHPWPEADQGPIRGSRWLYWSQRPTYQYYNLAVACKPEDTAELIKKAIEFAGTNLAGFIGVRELTTKSKYEKALNYDGPRNSVDLYFYPDCEPIAAIVEKKLRASGLNLRWHPSKSTGE